MKYAIAVLDIKPAEFWDLTLAEFNIAMESYMWKQEQEMELDMLKLARAAQWHMLPHVKVNDIPSIEKLLGKEPKKEEKSITTKDDLEEMKIRMGK